MPIQREGVDAYLREGCGRCPRFRTPSCKVHRYPEVLPGLRALALEAGLDETVKWGAPCYTVDGRNVVMLAAFDTRCVVSFLRGAELVDPSGTLEPAGPNARFARLVEVNDVAMLDARRPALRALLTQAVALEREGRRARSAPVEAELPDALAALLTTDATLQAAFAALTPGRRRSHALHVGGAKGDATRARRALACVPDIRAGRGFKER